ncbi:MAG: hypothetical protein IPJ41_01510 [Phycisphaerales bacterium]|nr:hypothetical protein [Phycisphaerales bacterium]
MERSKLIKIIVAAVIGIAAVAIIAMNLFGGHGAKEGAAAKQPPPPPAERSGGGRSAPGAKGD